MEPNTGENLLAFPSGGTQELEIGSQWIPSGSESDSSNLLNFPEADEGAFLSPQFRDPSLPQYLLPPLLSIGLDLLPSSDSGASNTDNITNDSTPTFAADLLTGSPVGVAKVQLYANGQFVGETTRRNSTQITSIPLTDGPHVLVARALNLAGSVLASSAPLTVTIDTSAPSLSLTAPIAGWAHSSTARLIGSAGDTGGGVPNIKYSLDGGSSSPVPVSAAGKFDAAIASNGLGLGDHNIGVIATDTAGNQASQSVDFSVTENFLIRKQGSTGWAAETANSIILHERDSWLTETAIPIQLGQTSGSRTLEFELDARFDTTDKTSLTEDRFQVWLVDTASPHSTLLDGQTPGKVLFSLAGDRAEFTPGLVRYNGSRVSIDLTGLQEIPTGFLLLRIINGDTDTGSAVSVNNLTDTTDPEGVASPIFPVQEKKAAIGPALDISNLTQTQALEVNLSDVLLNSATGKYTASLQVLNNGAATSRNVAVSFANLPAGVELQNASGVDAAGKPYINLRNAIQPGGLDAGETSAPVEVIFSNPNFSVVPVITSVFVGAPNTAPNFAPVGALTVKPGERLEIPLSATDANGDKVIYSIRSGSRLPKGKITGNGQLIFTPAPDDVGTYNFTLVASDGALETPQEVTLTVAADPVTTTRVSGVIENTAQEPLAGVIIELGSLQTVTAADGSFILETPGALPENTLKIRGEGISGDVTYPFIAEKLPLLLEHEVYTGVNNVISRPIYLPPIDTANAETIDPAADVTVTTANIPGASVFVAAGSLKDQQGNPYTGQLSITEVPAELTPAALPSNLHPDVVVTIQPGEMAFTTPAPLSLPNRAGYAPGTLMDLWSINPTTGLFDNVGTGKVSEDGSVIETISGGIRNSSWHFFGAQPQDPNQDERNPDEGGNECKENCNFTSVAELHSGAVMETHNLVSYQSLGAMRGLQLTYDSLRADPRPILHFGYDNTVPNPQGRLIADLTVSRGSFEYQLPGFERGNYGLKGGEHFWEIPETGGKIDAALQADMRSLSSGEYDYSLNSGVYLFDGEAIFGSSTESQGKILSVNTINSPWGSGWGLAGLQKLVENPNGSVLLIDGDGSELLFEASPLATGAYMAPPGDFSTLERLADGTFRRTMKDETVYSFNGHNKLALVTERNGNETQYVYNGEQKLAKIIDPVGLETTFSYNGGKVSAITDPAGRITRLEYDAAGNLTRIVDPDGSARTWEYDSDHHIVAEVDKRNNREETLYDFAGRALSATQKDGKSLKVAPVQVAGLYRPEETIDPFNAPVALALGDAESSQADGNGNVKSTILDSANQAFSARDGGGFLPSVSRNESNLVTDRTNSRGQVTEYEY
ncbi:MAG: hypothetical protein KME26_32380, partial [Oscillatoria princeps RMCB-10]|nr:hypothetical protein [Oscillatoria princeps RMCB-10]